MSQATGPRAASETLEALPPTAAGTLGMPEIVDDADAATVRVALAAAGDDEPPQINTGAQSQQAEMKADVSISASRAKRAMDREAATDDRINERVKRFLKTEADGFLQVTRLGPVEMPSTELGVVGQIRHEQLAAMTIAEVLSGLVGGGLFHIAAYRGDNTPVVGDAYTVQVVGDPKPKTRAGKAWLAKASREGSLDEPARAVAAIEEGGSSMMQFVMGFLERDKDRDRIRADADEQRRRHEADERTREWKERQEEQKAAREKELADLKAQRERERDEAKAMRERDLADFNARTAREASAAKAQLDAQIETMKNEAAFRLEQMKLDAEADRDRRKMLLDAESRKIETKETGGLGFEGLGKVREILAEAVGKAALKSAGMESEEEESPGLGGAIADVLRQEGPELVQKISNIFLPKLAERFLGGGPAAQAPAPQQVPNAPAPRQLPAPASPAPSGVPDFSTTAAAPAAEPDTVEAPDVEAPTAGADEVPAAQGVPTRQVALSAAANYALGSVLQFVRPLTVLALAQPDAEAAWDAPVGADGRTLADAFRLMPKNARETAATDWPKFLAAVNEASPPDAELWAEAVAQDGGEAWLKDFLAAGPWVPEETEA